MVARDAASQYRGPAAKAQRRVEGDRFAIHAGGDDSLRVDRIRSNRPRSGAGLVSRLSEHSDAQDTFIEARSGSISQDVAEPVAVVRDDDRRAAFVLVAVRALPSHVRPRATSEDALHGPQQRPNLGVSVTRLLYCLAVDSKRHVVDKGAAVDLAEIDMSLTPIDESIEGADHVVRVHAEIASEMVASAGRDASEGEAALRGETSDDRLRPIPAGDRERVCASVQRIADQFLEIGTGPELDGLDAARPGFVGKMEPSGFPAT